MEIVIDSCTGILLAKASILRKISETYSILITRDVCGEILKGKKKKFEDALIIEKLKKENIIKIVNINNNLKDRIKKDFNMGDGESSTIAYGIKNKCVIGTDNKQGRKAAKINNLDLVGSIEMVVDMYIKKKINKNKAERSLKILRKYGWFDNYLIEKAMEDIKNDRS